ncbi:TPA: site-2 protease family protein [Candidatus Taylorbacteria bacterium]|nr:site-2 protease family protein [Candidatus Taylorbacteria bacterium]
MQTTDIVFQLIILLFSAIIHEVAHGYAALFQGDTTAKYENRLTLNPLRHIDPFGSVILPLMLFLFHSPVLFGWAKPVPFNPYNLRNRKWGEAIVAAAGPAVNIIIALIFGLILRFGITSFPPPAVLILEMIVLINVMLAVFNLMPIPPLDGSKILFAFLPARAMGIRKFMEQYSMFFVLVFIFLLWSYIFPVVTILFSWITGLQF